MCCSFSLQVETGLGREESAIYAFHGRDSEHSDVQCDGEDTYEDIEDTHSHTDIDMDKINGSDKNQKQIDELRDLVSQLSRRLDEQSDAKSTVENDLTPQNTEYYMEDMDDHEEDIYGEIVDVQMSEYFQASEGKSCIQGANDIYTPDKISESKDNHEPEYRDTGTYDQHKGRSKRQKDRHTAAPVFEHDIKRITPMKPFKQTLDQTRLKRSGIEEPIYCNKPSSCKIPKSAMETKTTVTTLGALPDKATLPHVNVLSCLLREERDKTRTLREENHSLLKKTREVSEEKVLILIYFNCPFMCFMLFSN